MAQARRRLLANMWKPICAGVKNLEFISADGVQVGPEHREKALAGALQAAINVAAA